MTRPATTITSDAFLADPAAAMRLAADGVVIVTGQDGEPRMRIMRQREALEDRAMDDDEIEKAVTLARAASEDVEDIAPVHLSRSTRLYMTALSPDRFLSLVERLRRAEELDAFHERCADDAMRSGEVREAQIESIHACSDCEREWSNLHDLGECAIETARERETMAASYVALRARLERIEAAAREVECRWFRTGEAPEIALAMDALAAALDGKDGAE